MKRPLFVVGIFAVASALSTGCLIADDDPPPSVPPRGPSTPASTAPTTRGEPPHVSSIEIAEFPPVGPDGLVTVTCTDDRGLSSLIVNFHKRNVVAISGKNSTFSIPGGIL